MAQPDENGWQSIDRCANLTCPNRPGQGRFEVLASTDPIVGGHRPIVLMMCSPCAIGLRMLMLRVEE